MKLHREVHFEEPICEYFGARLALRERGRASNPQWRA